MILSVDFTLLPPPLVKSRFITIQELALSKGFRWFYSGSKVLRNWNIKQYSSWLFTVNFDEKQMQFEQHYRVISYREMYQKIKAL